MSHVKPTPCPYNDGVACEKANCESCGWNPKVAKARSEAIKRGKKIMSKEKLYKVPFTGYCEVWAESPEEAVDKADAGEMFFLHYDEYGDPVCLGKEAEDEVD